MLKPPRNRILAEQVAGALREAIVQGHFRPGQRLIEGELAGQLETSRGPIREAFVQLEHEGLVVIRPNRGAAVAELTRDDVDEIYGLRIALEKLATQLAAERGQESDFDRIQETLDQFGEALRKSITTQQAAAFDVRIHDAIVCAAHHRRLMRIWRSLRSQVYLVLYAHMVVDDAWRGKALAAHAGILAALRSGDGASASKLMESHIVGSYVRVKGYLGEPTREPVGTGSPRASPPGSQT